MPGLSSSGASQGANIPAQDGARTYVSVRCVSRFATAVTLDALPWPAINDLVQSISAVAIMSNGEEPSTWPLAASRESAQGNASWMRVAAHV